MDVRTQHIMGQHAARFDSRTDSEDSDGDVYGVAPENDDKRGPTRGGSAGCSSEPDSTQSLSSSLAPASRLQRALDCRERVGKDSAAEEASVIAREQLASVLPPEQAAKLLGRNLSGSLFQSVYAVGRVLGAGSSSVVCKCQCRSTEEVYAVKVVRVTAGSSSHEPEDKRANLKVVLNEVLVLSRLEHPGLLRLKELFVEGDCWYIVTTLMSGPELLQDVVESGCFTEAEARGVAFQLLTTLDHLHSRGVVHRDVKLENIMFEDACNPERIRLIDFGLATFYRPDEPLSDACGTPHCIAPEVLCPTPAYGPGVDVWASGVALFTLLAGVPPFVHSDFRKLFFTIRTGDFSFEGPAWSDVSYEAKDFLNHLLQTDPRKRPSAREALSHPWFRCDLDNNSTAETQFFA